MTTGGIIPTAIEFMDRTSVQAACEYLNETIKEQEAFLKTHSNNVPHHSTKFNEFFN